MSEKQFDYDTIISGASAAGLFAAHLLAQAGWRVAVFERRSVLGEPARTWIVTPELYRILGFDPAEAIINRVDHMELISPQTSTVLTLKAPDLIVERAQMIAQLEAKAHHAGAEIFKNHNVTHIKFSQGRVQVNVENGNTKQTKVFQARYLLGADGTYSQTARYVNAHPQTTVPVVQAHVKLPARYNPHWVKVWFERHDTKYFYWLIPESGEKAVLGLIADKTEGARYLLDQFCTRHGFQVTDYQGALIPLHQPLRQLEWHQQGARVLLIGDAAAHVKITTVGGLVSGLWGAKAATQSLIQGTSYASNLGALNRELYLHDLIRWTLNRFSNEDYTQLLGGLNQTLRTLLAQRNRDSMAHAIGELAFSQPKLSALAIYRLLFPYRVPSVLPVLNPLAQLAQLEPE